jgi:YegS/Rv2252/BmrU family lipid kinase
MEQQTLRYARSIFVVLNPVGGSSDPEAVRSALQRQQQEEQQYEIYETTGADDEDIGKLVREAVASGCDLVIAVGGDGTVSEVAEALAEREIPLAVIPTGTGNVFARELAIPLVLDQACALALGEFAIRAVDAMRLEGKLYVLDVSVGVGAIMTRDTTREAKRRWGNLAYLWTASKTMLGFQPQRFNIVVDGRRYRLNASHVVVANGGLVGMEPFRYGDDVLPDDGVLDLCVVNGRTVRDYVGILWHTITRQQKRSRKLRFYKVRQSISINARRALPVQADGEIVGTTPIVVEVVPGAVQVAVPPGIIQETG